MKKGLKNEAPEIPVEMATVEIAMAAGNTHHRFKMASMSIEDLKNQLYYSIQK